MLAGRILLIALFLHSAAAFARPTDDIADVGVSLYCLSHSRFGFENPKSSDFRVRYVIDQASFEGERRLVLLVEGTGGRLRLYDIVVIASADREYRLANNADLEKRNSQYHFASPPLGGMASQARLKRAFESIKGKPLQTAKAATFVAVAKRCEHFDYGS